MRFLIIGILSSLFISCGHIEKLYFKTYTYTNNSGHSLHIEKYTNEGNITYELPKLETINFRFEFNGGDCLINDERIYSSVPGGCLLIFADSLKIIFDDNKTLIFKLGDERNINILDETSTTKQFGHT